MKLKVPNVDIHYWAKQTAIAYNVCANSLISF
jgi:hypothetical protein